MAARTTDFAEGPRIQAFRAVERILREDPALAPRVRTWSTWRGDGNDALPLAASMCPYLQLSPVMRPSETLGIGAITAILGVRIRAAVAGLVAEDIVSFWDAIEDALSIGRPFRQSTVYCTLQGHRVYHHSFESPGIGAFESADNPPDKFLVGVGVLLLKIARTA